MFSCTWQTIFIHYRSSANDLYALVILTSYIIKIALNMSNDMVESPKNKDDFHVYKNFIDPNL